jgi:hypothetical protein
LPLKLIYAQKANLRGCHNNFHQKKVWLSVNALDPDPNPGTRPILSVLIQILP